MKITSLLLLSILAVIPATATAATHAETPDAGFTEAGAQSVPSGIDRITGTLQNGSSDVDVFAFIVTSTVNAVIDGIGPFDVNLLLLKEGFYGLGGDDDSGSGTNSQLSFTLTPGLYYIAIGINNTEAYQTGNPSYIWGNDDNPLNLADASAKIDHIASNYTSAGQTYEIALNFTTGALGALDLSSGKSLSKMIGEGVTGSATGNGQTVAVTGEKEVRFHLALQNSSFERTAGLALLGSAKSLLLKVVEKGSGNVTAAVKAGTYTKPMVAGAISKFEVSLRSTKPLARRPILFTASDSANPSILDTAGAVVTITPPKPKPTPRPPAPVPAGPQSPRFPRN